MHLAFGSAYPALLAVFGLTLFLEDEPELQSRRPSSDTSLKYPLKPKPKNPYPLDLTPPTGNPQQTFA